MEQDHIPRLSYRSMEVSYERSRGISGWAAALVEEEVLPTQPVRRSQAIRQTGFMQKKEQETKKLV